MRDMDTMEVLRGEHARFSLTVDEDSNYMPWSVEDQRRVRVEDLQASDCWDLLNIGFGNWDGTIMLLPLWALELMADGERLTSIMGNTAIVGQDEIDTDTRGGCLAYGFPHPGLRELENAPA